MTNQRLSDRMPIKQSDSKGVEDAKRLRQMIGRGIKMDAQPYIDAYPGKAVAIVNDLDGELENWLSCGARKVPRIGLSDERRKSFNDANESECARFFAGSTQGGVAYYAYVVVMDADLYDEVKNAPDRERMAQIRNAMYGGKSDETPGSFGSGDALKSYAPNLPTGEGRGFNEIRSK